ncbi:NAD(P)-dependent oxidoreductase [Jeotgalibacillus haloalkalitolerans]|uniref:NAD(P)-dependent oxidoreductase n=1 Tax=Jeotgalibacillus haloalkalitolerans TaxID=3104292 RepID=A0ABU5KNT6_9BACL|nr:NAD(P)-dependent oxidoreductase [Jeotgalibacillus sp. HH7-29]MDZ5712929.1 NAD(P)-dependent oxidoreductase [Jeotgalibacillus sp. HH7-29]
MKIGFIGTGVMGKSIVLHLLKDQTVHIYTRTKQKAQDLIDRGAVWEETPSALASNCDVIFTMVGYPDDVLEVYTGGEGIFKSAAAGSICIDLTTSKPELAYDLFEKGRQNGIHMIDAPVSGGDTGAKNGTLSIMAGGEENIFQQVLPLLQKFGSNIVFHGEAGSGQHTKMSNQIVIGSTMMGVCEALTYAVKSGLDPEKVLASISQGAAGSWSLSHLAPRILKSDYEPGFYIHHFIKDLKIALEESKRMGLSLPGLELALKTYEQAKDIGLAEKGTQALYKVYEDQI